MVFEICAGIATFALVILVYFIAQSLQRLQVTLKRVNELTAHLQTQIDPVGIDALRLLRNANQITDSINVKLNAFDPLFNSIHQATSVLEEKTDSLTRDLHAEMHHHVDKNALRSKDTLSNVIELVAVSILIWQQMNKRR